MANNTSRITVDDTSPAISYLPLRDTLSTVNLTAGWNPFFSESGFIKALGDTGVGTSFHATSLDGATISIVWAGTGIQLLGHTTDRAGYDVTLDGIPQQFLGFNESASILASFNDLEDSIHNISLIARIPSGETPGVSTIFFDSAQISTAEGINNITSDSLKDQDVSFRGKWSIEEISDQEFHRSITMGDMAETTFSGASLLLSGATSPTAATYSVILDDSKFTLSAQSSFTNSDSLLFFVTGLDPSIVHKIRVVNEDGGDLSLKIGGFAANAPKPPEYVATDVLPRKYKLISCSPATSSTLSESTTHTKGTIAALVLAGILGFLALSALLFFFFVLRPRRRRANEAKMEQQRRKEIEGEGVIIDISRKGFNQDLELGTPPKSSFARWKREVEGVSGTLHDLGISLRHSMSSGKRSAGRGTGGEPVSAKSSIRFASSSKAGRGSGRRKAKKQTRQGSFPSFALELPVELESSPEIEKDEDLPSDIATDGHQSITSGLTSLSYKDIAPPPAKPTPPSYSVSHSNRDFKADSTSAPAPVRHSMSHVQQNSASLLVGYTNNSKDKQNYNHYSPRDRNSAQYISDDSGSDLGSATGRWAIRGLSPRTSGLDSLHLGDKRNGKAGKEKGKETPLKCSSSIPNAEPVSHTPDSKISFLDVSTPRNRTIDIPNTELPDDAKLRAADRSFLDVRTSSPFNVDFATRILGRKGQASVYTASRTDHKPEEQVMSGSHDAYSTLRLTPASNPRGSFLDFSNSSDSSSRTHSIAPSEFSTQSQSRSHWSTVPPTPITRLTSSGISLPLSDFGGSSMTPYLSGSVPLPQPQHHLENFYRPSASQQHEASERYPARALRLSAFGPPATPSTSVTELSHRYSTSTQSSISTPVNWYLPSHPPLPEVMVTATSHAPA
ncbi:hypothetical protein H0H81_007119 [Sphagnurus paluster]|uniref:Uncharacterized protein n=1 Tax=Sphagnurus paluster TaxID=117069 RepID=A0A9P7GJN2_9AGAR|nr:hypothetical protein H0H81_007119 [Sphagnurus paluster]